MRPVRILAVLLALAAASSLLGQAPAPAKAAPPPAAPESGPAEKLAPGPTPVGLDSEEAKSILVEGESLYRHMADRDPFCPLVLAKSAKGSDVKNAPKKSGIGRFTVEACNLSAIVKTSKGEVAWFSGPDNKPYKVTVGEEFSDGKVTSVSYELGCVVVQQELINDSTHVKPFRDLRLLVRSHGGESK
jgi:hypothetical protein